MDAPEQHLVRWLNGRDEPCPVCGYNLRDLGTARCPECGAGLHLRVGSENTRLGAWLVGVLSLSLALGFDGVVATIMTTVAVFLEPPRTPAERFVAGVMVGSFVGLSLLVGAGIVAMVRGRARWVRVSPRRQWWMAAGVFVGTFALHAIWGIVLAQRL